MPIARQTVLPSIRGSPTAPTPKCCVSRAAPALVDSDDLGSGGSALRLGERQDELARRTSALLAEERPMVACAGTRPLACCNSR
jgi:hypothetical protein